MAPRKRTAAKATGVMCDNHPGTPAEHTTTSALHQPISLCQRCLEAAQHLRDR